MSAMTAEQQRFLVLAYSAEDWTTAEILLSDDGIKRAKEGQRGGNVRGEDFLYFETTGRGIGTYRLTRPAPNAYPQRVDERLVVPWTAVSAHRKTIPAATLDRLRAAQQECKDHSRRFPTPYPDLGVRKVGPSGDIHPDDRELYRQRMDAYQRDVVDVWRREHRALIDARRDAVLACLPLALDDEPADLLELLAATEP